MLLTAEPSFQTLSFFLKKKIIIYFNNLRNSFLFSRFYLEYSLSIQRLLVWVVKVLRLNILELGIRTSGWAALASPSLGPGPHCLHIAVTEYMVEKT